MELKMKAAQIVGNAKRYIRSCENHGHLVVAFNYCQLGLRWLQKHDMIDEHLEVVMEMDCWGYCNV
jgi:hypothetical protein